MSDINEQARVSLIVDGAAAGSELDDLRTKAASLTQQMRDLDKANDLEGFRKAEKEYKATQKSMQQLQKQVVDVDRVMNNLSGSSLNDLNKVMRKLQAELKGAARGTQEWADKSKQLQRVSTEVNKVKAEMNGVSAVVGKGGGGGLSGMFAKLGPMIAAAFAFGAIKEFIGNVVRVRSEFEKYEAVLKNSLGSAQAARIEMGMLQAFAAKTPFQLNALTGAYVKLVNQGFKPTEEQMRQLGDIASSTGKEFDMLAEAVIDAQVGEFERLKEFGIRAQKEGDKVKFTFKGVSTQVDFTNQSIQQYILSLGDTVGVSGSMAEISKTLGGTVSNLSDSWDNYLNTLGSKTGGIFKTVMGWVSSFIGSLQMATMSIAQIKEMVLDDATRQNLKDSIEEINVMTQSLQKNGMEAGKAEERAMKLWKDGRDAQTKGLKAEAENATGTEKERLERRIELLIAEQNIVNDHYKALAQIKNKQNPVKDLKEKELTAELEKEYKRREVAIYQAYNDEVITKEQVDEELARNELLRLTDSIDLLKKHHKDTVDLEAELQKKIAAMKEKAAEDSKKSLDQQTKDQEDYLQDEIDLWLAAYNEKDRLKKEAQAKDLEQLNMLEQTEGTYNLQLQLLDQMLAAGEIKESEHAKKVADIHKKLKDQKVENLVGYLQAAQELGDVVTQFQEAAKNRELAAAGDNAKKKEEIEKKYAKKQQAIAIAQTIIQGALEIAKIWTAANINVPLGITMTAIAAARTIGSVALIASQQFDEGGFTGAGGKYEPAGTVHRGEYVIPQEGVNNPTMAPVLSAIEMARQSGRLSQLNLGSISNGYAKGGLVGSPTDPNLINLLAQNAKSIANLNAQLARGLRTNFYYSEFDKMNSEVQSIKSRTTIS